MFLQVDNEDFSNIAVWVYTGRVIIIKALTALMGRLPLSVGWENGLERGLKTVSFNHFHLTRYYYSKIKKPYPLHEKYNFQEVHSCKFSRFDAHIIKATRIHRQDMTINVDLPVYFLYLLGWNKLGRPIILIIIQLWKSRSHRTKLCLYDRISKQYRK